MSPKTLAAAGLLLFVLACGDSDAPGSTGEPAATAGSPQALNVTGVVTLHAGDDGDAAAGVATGDFNGDGAVDVVLAAAFADGPDDGREDSGEALVFLGPFQPGETRDAAAGEHDAVIYGADTGDQAGRAVTAGDLNGDGLDDVIIGVPFGSGPANDRPAQGEVAVVFGTAGLGDETTVIDLASGADVLLIGRAEGDLTGFALATGDLNGDEFADLIAGSFQASAPDGTLETGVVDVVYGSARPRSVLNLAEEPADATVYGPSEGAWLGESVSAGDFDGDGHDDLLLSATFALTLSGEEDGGRVYVIPSPLPPLFDLAEEQAEYVVYGADNGDQIGHSSATGDVDGDGLDDALLGAVSADGEDNAVNLAGEVALILGRSMAQTIDLAAGDQDVAVYGVAEAGRLGRSVAVGDIDGDQFADLALGVPGADAPDPPTNDTGAIYVIRGGGSFASPVNLGQTARAYFGTAGGDELSNGVEGRPPITITDIDSDGRGEIIVSSSNAGPREESGSAYILFIGPL